MRCALLTTALLAALPIVATPASAADRFCARWVRSIDYDPSTGGYHRPALWCARWVVLPRQPQPVPGLIPPFQWGGFGDLSPYMSESQFRSTALDRVALNPQPLPPRAVRRR